MDSHNLSRFEQAQRGTYERALLEIANGQKTGHCIWFIFPQLVGLGHSDMSLKYGLAGMGEARAYLAHPLNGPRLEACANALLAVDGRTITQIMGTPDDKKLRSCATLFAAATPPGSVFEQLLAKYHQSQPDHRTLKTLRDQGEAV